MTAADLVRDRLLDIAGVTALVSTRVYGQVLPQGFTAPAVRVQQISEVEPYHLRGTTGTAVTRVQVDYIATTKAAAEQLEAAAHGDGLGSDASGLSGWRGHAGVSSPQLLVDLILPDGRREAYDPDELRLYVISRDYLVSWRTS